MRHRQRAPSCGVDTAATCTGLPPTPALASTATGTITKVGGLSRLHRQPPPVQFVSVEFLDRRLGRFCGRHLHESEAARTASLPVHHDLGRLNGTDRSKYLAKPLAGRRKRQAADEEFMCHWRHLLRGSSAVGDTPWNPEDGARAAVWLPTPTGNQRPSQTLAV